MQKISKDQQENLQPQIEQAFDNGSGDCFMQKDNFSEILAVHKSKVTDYETKGYTEFMLYSYERPTKTIVALKPIEVIDYEKEKERFYDRTSQCGSYLDDYPEFYNHSGL